MPFDGSASRPFAPLTLEALASVLRDRSQWPEESRWDYTNYCGCAIGLAERLVGRRLFTEEFGINDRQATMIFCFAGDPKGKIGRPADVTPEDVADMIDSLLGKCPIPPRQLSFDFTRA